MIHKLIIKSKSAKTACNRYRVIAFYPEANTAIAFDKKIQISQYKLECSLEDYKVTCPQCIAKQ